MLKNHQNIIKKHQISKGQDWGAAELSRPPSRPAPSPGQLKFEILRTKQEKMEGGIGKKMERDKNGFLNSQSFRDIVKGSMALQSYLNCFPQWQA